MAAPAKFLFDIDFAAPDRKEKAATPAEIAALVAEKAFEYLDAPLVRVTAPDTPVPFSPPLEEAFLPGPATLAAAARKLAAY